MPISLLALVTDSSRLEWLDLAALFGLFVGYLLLALRWPEYLLRPLWWLLTHTIYRLRVYGRGNIPPSGPALLLCNHVSYVDWMLIWAASPRPVRFVAWAGHAKNPLLRMVMRVTRALPVDGNAGPKATVRSLQAISEALDRGEVVCIFPEARLTRTGKMLKFHRGFERIVTGAKVPVPIIPVCISQLWGSIFSYRGGKIIRKWPERIPYPVAVSFGPPLPPSTPAPQVRLKIQELSADTAIRESDRSRAVHRHFVRAAARFRQMFRPCLIDTTGAKLRTLSY